MMECTATRSASVNPGQQPDIDSKDTFTIVQVLSKTNAAMIEAVTRAEYHERQTRTIGPKLNDLAVLEAKVIEMEEKISNQANAEEVINKMAEVIKGTGTRGEGGAGKPVSEHKAIQQLNNFIGDRAKFREWNEKLLNALGQVNVKNRRALEYISPELETLDGALQ